MSVPSLDEQFDLNRGFILRWTAKSCQLLLRILFRIFFKLRFEGVENLPEFGPYLICPNHQSYLDPFFVYAFLPSRVLERTIFIADRAYFSRPWLSWMNRFGRVLLTAGRNGQAECFQLAQQALQRGLIVCVFPEGCRTKTGEVMEPHRGAGILACSSNASIVPVRIRGAVSVLSRLNPGFHFCKISITIGKPLPAHEGVMKEWKERVGGRGVAFWKQADDTSAPHLDARRRQWEIAKQTEFDVAIIGGGINGASLYHHLCREGYSTLLIDRGDFASGTSQASAMMIWGGLLYMRNLDFGSVLKLSTSRERMISGMQDWVKPRTFRYLADSNARNAGIVSAALQLYWLMSGMRRMSPVFETDFPEREFLNRQRFSKSLIYEEACVQPSDARFVLNWILPYNNEIQIPLNHCALQHGDFDHSEKKWHLLLQDALLGEENAIRTRVVINAAGVWTDAINSRFGIDSQYKHVFSKGVFIGIKRPEQHTTPLIIDAGNAGDCMSLIPWGPISLWGPTETRIESVDEGFHVNAADIDQLLTELSLVLRHAVTTEDIISLRCGVRPLAVHRAFNEDCNPLDLSRRSRIVPDRDLSWISIYGGKLTDCVSLAHSGLKVVRQLLPDSDRCTRHEEKQFYAEPQVEYFPGLQEPVMSPSWSAKNELCWTLEDYLRRRTNVAQWISRGGFGKGDENVAALKNIARVFCGDEDHANEMLFAYREKIRREFDEVLEGGNVCSLTA